MEESSEKRRDRLRAMREEAMASPASSPSIAIATTSSSSSLEQPPLLQHHLPSSPISRFDYYTDPLSSFSQKKKFRSSAPPSHGSPLWQPDFLSNPGFCSPQPSPAAMNSFDSASLPPPSTLGPSSQANDRNNDFQTRNYGSNSPGPGCDPRSGFGSPQPSPLPHMYGSGFGNPHPSPAAPYPCSNASLSHSMVTPPSQANEVYSNMNNDSRATNYGHSPGPRGSPWRGGFNRSPGGRAVNNTDAPYPYSNSSQSPHSLVTPPSQDYEGYSNRNNVSKTRNYGSSPGSRGSPWTGGFSRSPGGRGTPGVNRDARGMGRSGSRNFQRLHKSGNVSARDHPELFVKKSMVTDPWKDLVPVRLDIDAFLVDNRAEPSSTKSPQEWLPKSISTNKVKATDVKLNIASSGPSLAESLAAAFADAVSGENDRTDLNANEIS